MKKLITVAILALSLAGLAQETPKETKREMRKERKEEQSKPTVSAWTTSRSNKSSKAM